MAFRQCISLAIAPILVILTGWNGPSPRFINAGTLAQETIAEDKKTEANELVEDARQQLIEGRVELGLLSLRSSSGLMCTSL